MTAIRWKNEWKYLLGIVGIFLLFFYLPIGDARFDNAIFESLYLAQWYAQEHVLLCLIPAFFIAGAIAVFVSQAAVMKYLGARANKVLAYGVASVSGSVLAVCSCTVLPLFAGIYRMGAGLGPATAFLYSGPAINVLAIVLTANVLGMELGIARSLGAVIFSIVIGLLMALFFRKEEREKTEAQIAMPEPEVDRPLWKNGLYFASMVLILVFANWGKPLEDSGIWFQLYELKWTITSIAGLGFALILVLWLGLQAWKMLAAVLLVTTAAFLFPHTPQIPFVSAVVLLSLLINSGNPENSEWFSQSWGFAKQILPLLMYGVIFAGLLLGRPGHQGLIPSEWISSAVGGNSVFSNFFAAFAGAFMYFATLTEIPILQGLIANGMGKGPALALLLAGPALSLPNMLVIHSVLKTRKTIAFVSLVIVMATISGLVYGTF